jgi:hypothetical protein
MLHLRVLSEAKCLCNIIKKLFRSTELFYGIPEDEFPSSIQILIEQAFSACFNTSHTWLVAKALDIASVIGVCQALKQCVLPLTSASCKLYKLSSVFFVEKAE